MESPVQEYLDGLRRELEEIKDGVPLATIPSNPDQLGISLTTVDGYNYSSGDADVSFSIQSTSKIFTYGLALADLGFEAVDEKIDVEPSGEGFDMISLSPTTRRPKNALINAGAIAAASLIKSRGPLTSFERIRRVMSEAAGRDLDVDASVYAQEASAGSRNKALAWLLVSNGTIEGDPLPALADYTQQCAVKVTAKDLAMMAATLANLGTNPITGTQVLPPEVVQRVLSVMTTCGMYDDSGDWVSQVGMPAKSGVGGGILSVLPGQVGLATFSPPLDKHGNSVRGLAAARRISHDMGLHFVRTSPVAKSTVRETFPVNARPSAVRRNDAAEDVLEKYGNAGRVIQLTGDLLFAGAEAALRELGNTNEHVKWLILDVVGVDEVDETAVELLSTAVGKLKKDGVRVALRDPGDVLGRVRDIDSRYRILELAIEWAEEHIITEFGGPECRPAEADTRNFPILTSMSDEHREAIEDVLQIQNHPAGHVIRRRGQKFSGIYFVVSGRVDNIAVNEDGERRVVSTLTPGMTFGELGLAESGPQPLTVKADTDVRLSVLRVDVIEKLGREQPEVAVALWQAISANAYARIGHLMVRH